MIKHLYMAVALFYVLKCVIYFKEQQSSLAKGRNLCKILNKQKIAWAFYSMLENYQLMQKKYIHNLAQESQSNTLQVWDRFKFCVNSKTGYKICWLVT